MKILCVGLMVCDIITQSASKEIFNKDHMKTEGIDIGAGGDAFNVASNLTLLGVPGCLCSAVGGDGVGTYILDYARKLGMDVGQIKVMENPTSVSLILLERNGERHFISQSGASQFLTGQEVTDELLDEHDILYIGSACDLPGMDGKNMEHLLQRAKAHGLVTCMDVTGNPGKEDFSCMKPSLELLDFFFPSDYEALSLTGQEDIESAAAVFLKMGVGTVIVKRGAYGSMLVSKERPDEYRYFPPYQVEVVDTTGAGDAFVSGFLAAYSQGFPVDVCIRIATLTGSDCITKVGSSGNLRHISYYLQLLKQDGRSR